MLHVPGLIDALGFDVNKKIPELDSSNFNTALYFILSSNDVYKGLHELKVDYLFNLWNNLEDKLKEKKYKK